MADFDQTMQILQALTSGAVAPGGMSTSQMLAQSLLNGNTAAPAPMTSADVLNLRDPYVAGAEKAGGAAIDAGKSALLSVAQPGSTIANALGTPPAPVPVAPPPPVAIQPGQPGVNYTPADGSTQPVNPPQNQAPVVAQPTGGGVGLSTKPDIDLLAQQRQAALDDIRQKEAIEQNAAKQLLPGAASDEAESQLTAADTAARAREALDRAEAASAQMAKQAQIYANSKLDTDFWGSRSTPQKIGIAASMFLGAIGAGSNGGVNTAAKIYLDSRDQDIQQQREAFERHRDAANTYADLMKQNLAIIPNIKIANDATTAQMHEAAQQRLTAQLLRDGNAVAAQKATEAIANTDTDGLKLRESLRTGILNQIKTGIDAAQAKQNLIEQKYRFGREALGNQTLDQMVGRVLPKGLATVYGVNPDGSSDTGFAPSPENAQAYTKEATAPGELATVVKHIQDLRADGVEKNQAALQAATLGLKQQIEAMGGSGQLSTRTEDIIKSASGDPAQYFGVLPGSQIDKRLDELAMEAASRGKNVELRHGIFFPNRLRSKEHEAK